LAPNVLARILPRREKPTGERGKGMVRSVTLARAAAIVVASIPFVATSQAQQTPVATPSPSPIAAPTPTQSPAAPAATPSPAATPAPTPDSGDSGAMGETVDLVSRPAAFLEGKADRDEVYSAITGAIAAIRAEIAKDGLKAAGHPIAVFLEADDAGFHFRAEVPIETAPEGKTQLSDTVKLGQTPVGKAMRFEHRLAYDDIDGTYEAITAYLDEKGVDAQDLFIEEYLNDVKSPEDPSLKVDIYVLLK
jgi:effector-binding domain-containing protein